MAIHRTKKLIQKGIASLGQNGLRVTLTRIRRKLDLSSRKLAALAFDAYSEEMLEAQRAHSFDRNVKFSILVPLYNTPISFLEEMIHSVQAQTYRDWELCLADGSDADHPEVEETVRRLAEQDSRILYRRLEENRGISGNTNACIEMATGDYISLFDHDDVLHPAALYETMRAICEEAADLVYTDEVTFESPDLRRIFSVHFKPDYAPDNLRSNNYICHFTSFSRPLLEEAGSFRSEYDGSQDHDMILRLTACAKKIVHIPKILYFWRSHPQSVAMDINSKTYAISAGQRAVTDAVQQMGLDARVSSTDVFAAIYRLRYEIKQDYKITIILPALCSAEQLSRCIDSIENQTTYPNYEILLVYDPSRAEHLQTLLGRVSGCCTEKISSPIQAYQLGAQKANGDVLLFLNPNTQVVTAEWLEELLMYAQRSDVGAVGPLMTLHNRNLWHTGMILGLGKDGTIDEPFRGFPLGYNGYMGRLGYAQNVSALSGDCLMIRKEVFCASGGFDVSYQHSLFDADFCLKLRSKGYRNVWTPFAQLNIEPASQTSANNGDVKLFAQRWSREVRKGDPYYNPNFSAAKEGFRISLKK